MMWDSTEFERAVLKNGRNLLSDAKILLRNKRPTGVALVVLALEEFGKYALQSWTLEAEGQKRVFRIGYHKTKQLAVFSIGACIELLEFVDEINPKIEYWAERHPDDHDWALKDKNHKTEDFVKSIDAYKKAEEAVSAYFTFLKSRAERGKQVYDTSLILFEFSAIGILEELKHNAFYVDERNFQNFAPEECKVVLDFAPHLTETVERISLQLQSSKSKNFLLLAQAMFQKMTQESEHHWASSDANATLLFDDSAKIAKPKKKHP